MKLITDQKFGSKKVEIDIQSGDSISFKFTNNKVENSFTFEPFLNFSKFDGIVQIQNNSFVAPTVLNNSAQIVFNESVQQVQISNNSFGLASQNSIRISLASHTRPAQITISDNKFNHTAGSSLQLEVQTCDLRETNALKLVLQTNSFEFSPYFENCEEKYAMLNLSCSNVDGGVLQTVANEEVGSQVLINHNRIKLRGLSQTVNGLVSVSAPGFSSIQLNDTELEFDNQNSEEDDKCHGNRNLTFLMTKFSIRNLFVGTFKLKRNASDIKVSNRQMPDSFKLLYSSDLNASTVVLTGLKISNLNRQQTPLITISDGSSIDTLTISDSEFSVFETLDALFKIDKSVKVSQVQINQVRVTDVLLTSGSLLEVEAHSVSVQALALQNLTGALNSLLKIKSQGIMLLSDSTLSGVHAVSSILEIDTSGPMVMLQNINISDSVVNAATFTLRSTNMSNSICSFTSLSLQNMTSQALFQLKGFTKVEISDSNIQVLQNQNLIAFENTNATIKLYKSIVQMIQGNRSLFKFKNQANSQLVIDGVSFYTPSCINLQTFNYESPQSVQIVNSHFSGLQREDENQTQKLFEFINYQSTPVQMRNNTFENFRNCNLIISSNSSLNLQSTSVQNISNGRFLAIFDSGFINVTNSKFENISTQEEGATLMFVSADQNASRNEHSKLNITFQDVTANNLLSKESNGLLQISSNLETDINFDNVTFNNSQSSKDFSVGTIQSSHTKSRLTMTKCTILNSLSQSTGTLKLQMPQISLTYLNFHDNLATSLTHGLILSGDQFFANIKNSMFSSNQHSKTTAGLNGTYIYIPSSSTENLANRLLWIKGTQLKMGNSEFGGAVYIRGQIEINVTDSNFYYNRAAISGAAVYFDQVVNPKIKFDQNVFQVNQALVSGDVIFASEASDFHEGTKRRLQANSSSYFELNSATFSSLLSSAGYLQFKNITQLRCNNLTFEAAFKPLAMFGGSIMCQHCHQVTITNSIFNNQESTVAGGALYISADDATSSASLTNLTFKENSSHKGGAINFENVVSVLLQNSTFDSNYVHFKDQDSFNTYLLAVYRSRSSEVINQISQKQQLFAGKGPDIFYSCQLPNCNFDIVGVNSNNSYVVDDLRGMILQQNYGSIFYEQDRPTIVEKTNVTTNLNESLSLSSLVLEAEDFVLIADEEVSKYGDVKKSNFQLFQALNFTQREFYQRFQNFTIGSDLLSKSKIYLVDKLKQPQLVDSTTNIEVTIQNLDIKTINESQIQTGFLINGKLVQNISAKAIEGVIDLSNIKVYGPPGSTLGIKMIFNSKVHFTTKNYEFQIKTKQCGRGNAVNSLGVCQLCPGPNYYSLQVPEPIQKRQFQCMPCNHTKVFKCNGGANIQAVSDIEMVSGQEFAKCNKISGVSLCLGNNKCAEGYSGVMCKQCQKQYFKNFLGECIHCSSTALHVVNLIFTWILLVLTVFIMVTLHYNSLKKNSYCILLGLVKNLMNYFVFFTLISLVFVETWSTIENQDSSYSPPFSLNAYKKFVWWMYSVPITSVNSQCISADQNHKNGHIKENSQKTVSRDADISFQTPQLLQTFVLALILTIVCVTCFLVASYCKVKKTSKEESTSDKDKEDEKVDEPQQKKIAIAKDSRPQELAEGGDDEQDNKEEFQTPKIGNEQRMKNLRDLNSKIVVSPDFESNMSQSSIKPQIEMQRVVDPDLAQKPVIRSSPPRKSRLLIGASAILVNVQIIQQILMLLKCEQRIDELSGQPIEDIFTNYYDSSILCPDSNLFITVCTFYILFWCALAPALMLWVTKKSPFYLHMYLSFMSKVIILFAIVYASNETFKIVFLCLILAAQVLLVRYERKHSLKIFSSSDSFKINRMALIDCVMYVCLFITAIISVIFNQELLIEDMNLQAHSQVIPILNALYLLIWATFTAKHSKDEIKQNLPLLYSCLTCGDCRANKAKIGQNLVDETQQKMNEETFTPEDIQQNAEVRINLLRLNHSPMKKEGGEHGNTMVILSTNNASVKALAQVIPNHNEIIDSSLKNLIPQIQEFTNQQVTSNGEIVAECEDEKLNKQQKVLTVVLEEEKEKLSNQDSKSEEINEQEEKAFLNSEKVIAYSQTNYVVNDRKTPKSNSSKSKKSIRQIMSNYIKSEKSAKLKSASNKQDYQELPQPDIEHLSNSQEDDCLTKLPLNLKGVPMVKASSDVQGKPIEKHSGWLPSTSALARVQNNLQSETERLADAKAKHQIQKQFKNTHAMFHRELQEESVEGEPQVE